MRLDEAVESDMNMRRHYRRVDYSCINSVDSFLDVYSQSWKQNCMVNVSLCPVYSLVGLRSLNYSQFTGDGGNALYAYSTAML